MSEEPKAREKPETQKAWFNGPLKLSPSADPAKFPWLPDPATIQRIEEMQRTSQSWQKLMGPTLASFNEINQRFAEAFGGIHRLVQQQAKLFQSGVNSAFFEQARKFHELESIDWEAIGREHAQAARELADRGWFLSMDFPFYSLRLQRRFLVMIRHDRWEECEWELEEYFEERLPTIQKDLTTRFAQRKAILEEAFEHHCEGKYFGAISLFLSQSEGIGKDIFGASPISREPKNLQTLKDWVDQRVDRTDLFDEFWQSILRVLPMTENTKRLGAYKDPLNRHLVLHGDDLTYGTKRNSLKAIAWIQYVASFAMLDDENGPSESAISL